MIALKMLWISILAILILNAAHAVSITSFSINDNASYTNSPLLNLSINAAASEMRFSCDGTNWSAWEAYASSKRFTLDTSYGCTLSDGNKVVYIEVRAFDGNALASDSIIFDSKGPSKPSAPTPVLENGIAKISWSASSDSSGIGKYVLRIKEYGKETKEFSISISGNETSYQHPAKERHRYCYSLMAYDNAGNSSQYSDEQCIVTSTTGPDVNIAVFDANMQKRDFNGVSYFRNEMVFIKVFVKDELKDINGYILQGSEKNMLNFSKAQDGYIASYILKPVDGLASVHVSVTDYLDLNKSSHAEFFVDSTAPDLNIVLAKQKSETQLLLKAIVSGDTTKLYIDVLGQRYLFETQVSDKDKGFEALLDLNNVQELLKINVTAFDRAENTKSIALEKFFLLKPTAKIKDVEVLADSLKSKLDFAKELAIFTQPELTASLADARALIEGAKHDIESQEYEPAREKLEKIKATLELISSRIANVAPVKKYEIDYNAEKAVFYSELSGYFREIPMQTKELWDSLAIKREVTVFEIQVAEKLNYAAVVSISIKNSSAKKLAPFWIVELIPKTIAGDFSMLRSNTVLEHRPRSNIVDIPIKALMPDEMVAVRYTSTLMSQQEYEKFKIEMAEFYLPVPVKEKGTEVAFVHTYERPNLAPLAIAILAVAFAYIFYRRAKK